MIKGSTRAGQATAEALRHICVYLPNRGLDANGKLLPGVFTTYLISVLLPTMELGQRSEKELRTLGAALDLMTEGFMPEALDVLVGRFQSVETAELLGWPAASHLELIPTTLVSSVSERSRTRVIRRVKQPSWTTVILESVDRMAKKRQRFRGHLP